jgi:hypothetical protein
VWRVSGESINLPPYLPLSSPDLHQPFSLITLSLSQLVIDVLHLAEKKNTMATVRLNAVTKGMSGSIGNLMFRQTYGRTIVSAKPRPSKKQSEQQRVNRSRFKMATGWAKAQMLDPDKKAYYWRKAKKLKLPNAYTAAISDYMRKGEIKEINTKAYKGKAGDMIHFKIHKKDFAVRDVSVAVYTLDGRIIESGYAAKKDNGRFIYKASQTLQEKIPIKIRIQLNEHVWNAVTAEQVVHSDNDFCRRRRANQNN